MSYRTDCTDCRPNAPCYRHEIVADGKSVRVPLTMMDGMPAEVRDMLQRGQRAIDEANAPDNGYAAFAASLDYRTRSQHADTAAPVVAKDRAALMEAVNRQPTATGQGNSAMFDAYYAQAEAQNAAANQRAIQHAKDNAARFQAHVDAHHRSQALRDGAGDVRDRAYAESCAQLQRGGRA